MRVSIPHTLGKDELRRRMAARLGEAEDKARGMLGGLATVETSWTDEDTLGLMVSAMGYTIPCTATIAETALDFEVEIPAGAGFARRMIEAAVREKGEKLVG
ncbi:hypothetical protein AQZ52_01800 [Novosphingobium fuchskuhlense]|uniref:Polyhydroxyalkanoic acid system protein n=1 Tax=Novosphingobium fuchskuhlense TaxID=1117702 RepID=A0A117UZI4_9SPHN|nr:polyhydroxyalkanoic acid system family protein [Novosphingobium fuchskuhlense]KUR73724.1 hypothetical protein AQZ52_01800 [Novosphingobium fuchskuhlense]